ncbi:uncharacterized protein LOC144782941 [Lissotriton helveticus]
MYTSRSLCCNKQLSMEHSDQLSRLISEPLAVCVLRVSPIIPLLNGVLLCVLECTRSWSSCQASKASKLKRHPANQLQPPLAPRQVPHYHYQSCGRWFCWTQHIDPLCHHQHKPASEGREGPVG